MTQTGRLRLEHRQEGLDAVMARRNPQAQATTLVALILSSMTFR